MPISSQCIHLLQRLPTVETRWMGDCFCTFLTSDLITSQNCGPAFAFQNIVCNTSDDAFPLLYRFIAEVAKITRGSALLSE